MGQILSELGAGTDWMDEIAPYGCDAELYGKVIPAVREIPLYGPVVFWISPVS